METKFIIIFGMHRSGTSLLARSARVFGASLGENLFAGNEGNPGGYFEDVGLMELDNAMLTELDMSWDSLGPVTEKHVSKLADSGYMEKAACFLQDVARRGPVVALKDPRMTRLAPFWRRVFRKLKIVPKCMVGYRKPAAVVHSLGKRSTPGGRPDLLGYRSYAAYLWLGYTLASFLYTSGYPRVLVRYEKFLDQPREILPRIGEMLDLQVNEKELDLFCNSFVDKRLNNYPGDNIFGNKLPHNVEILDYLVGTLPDFAFPTPVQTGPMWPGDEDGQNLCAFLDETLDVLRSIWRRQMAGQI